MPLIPALERVQQGYYEAEGLQYHTKQREVRKGGRGSEQLTVVTMKTIESQTLRKTADYELVEEGKGTCCQA